MADMQELIARLEAAEVGGRELDWLIAKALFGFSMWKSKHGHWNINWPDDWPFSSRPLHCSVPGRLPEDIFDSETGKRLPPEIEPTEWLDEVECPIWTTSLDAALALAERLGLDGFHTVYAALMNWKAHDPRGPASQTLPLALCIAILKAKAQGEGG